MAPSRFDHDVHDPLRVGGLSANMSDKDETSRKLDLPYANDRYETPAKAGSPRGDGLDRSGAQFAMTRLGYFGLVPFYFGAGVLWLSPWLVAPSLALIIQQGTLAYAGIIASYMAGMGAGGLLTRDRPGIMTYLSGMIAVLIAWLMIVPDGYFFFSMSPVWRTLILAGVFIYLYARDLQMAVADDWPRWYSDLRFKLTAWVVIALIAIFARLLLWGFA